MIQAVALERRLRYKWWYFHDFFSTTVSIHIKLAQQLP
jgi:hypothetical protein